MKTCRGIGAAAAAFSVVVMCAVPGCSQSGAVTAGSSAPVAPPAAAQPETPPATEVRGPFLPPVTEAGAETAGPLQKNMVVILDASGSMRSLLRYGSTMTRMDAARAALWEALSKVPLDTNIGLLVFGACNLKDGWAYPLAPRHNATLMQAIDYPKPLYGTPLGAFIKTGADRLLEQRAKQGGYGTYRLLIVTDGEASDPKLLEKHVPEVLGRGITVDVIGVAMKGTHTLATRAHSYRNASDLASLKKAVADVTAELGKQASDSALDEQAFGDIAPLPEPVVRAILKALCDNPNHPIGEKPKLAPAGPP